MGAPASNPPTCGRGSADHGIRPAARAVRRSSSCAGWCWRLARGCRRVVRPCDGIPLVLPVADPGVTQQFPEVVRACLVTRDDISRAYQGRAMSRSVGPAGRVSDSCQSVDNAERAVGDVMKKYRGNVPFLVDSRGDRLGAPAARPGVPVVAEVALPRAPSPAATPVRPWLTASHPRNSSPFGAVPHTGKHRPAGRRDTQRSGPARRCVRYFPNA